MGWWRSGQDGDIIGDGPADILIDAFEQIEQLRAENHGNKPTLSDLLEEVLGALKQRPEVLLQDSASVTFWSLVAEFEDGTMITLPPKRSKSASRTTGILFDAFEDIAMEYEGSEVRRKPRLTELLATVAFVLRNRLARYTSYVPGSRLKEIRTCGG